MQDDMLFDILLQLLDAPVINLQMWAANYIVISDYSIGEEISN